MILSLIDNIAFCKMISKRGTFLTRWLKIKVLFLTIFNQMAKNSEKENNQKTLMENVMFNFEEEIQ